MSQNTGGLLPEEWQTPTVKLVLINVIFYIIEVFIGGSFIFVGNKAIFLFGLSIRGLLQGRIWLLVTSIFTHAHIAHIGMNMILLLIFGLRLEERGYNDNGLYFGYIVTGVLSGILSLLIFFSINDITVGASGAVFGLIGINVGLEKKMNDPNYKKILGFSLLIFIFSSGATTNVFAHAIGWLVGYFIGLSDYYQQFNENIQSLR